MQAIAKAEYAIGVVMRSPRRSISAPNLGASSKFRTLATNVNVLICHTFKSKSCTSTNVTKLPSTSLRAPEKKTST